MSQLDWLVVAAYMGGLLVFAALQARRQRSLEDYYLGSRQVRWWQSGMSTMATQLGAISFVSAPAFVAAKEGGGLKWLCYEFGVPIGILIAMMWIVPELHRGRYISIYQLLEDRFDRGTRSLVSVFFQLGRGLATAVSVLAGGIILSTATPLTTSGAILLIGAVTVLYDVLGGLKVVVLSDVLQLAVIVIGIGICGGTALYLVGWNEAWAVLDPQRLQIVDWEGWGTSSGGEYGFWPMLLGGIFLYASYYGCDQSQVQRELSVHSQGDVRRSLMLNAFGRFPLVLLYCVMGVLIGAVFTVPGLVESAAAKLGTSSSAMMEALGADPDRMVPTFILAFLPAGVVGLVLVAILSALMSSLDSAINSLSAVTMQDFYRVYVRPKASERHYLVVSKLLALFWGAFCILAALGFAAATESARATTIVLINAVGSLLYGPILAAFFIAVATKTVTAFEVKIGVLIGILTDVLLWRLTEISWLWWNAAGFFVAVLVTLGYHELFHPLGRRTWRSVFLPWFGSREELRHSHVAVIGYTFFIIIVSLAIQKLG